jgi:cytochrome oxidase Cu insertion factor (SCO1/SenC/PrrC family)
MHRAFRLVPAAALLGIALAGCGTSAVPAKNARPAPEIEGEDQDGVTFKLSDYRGKVILLDFWGNW